MDNRLNIFHKEFPLGKFFLYAILVLSILISIPSNNSVDAVLLVDDELYLNQIAGTPDIQSDDDIEHMTNDDPLVDRQEILESLDDYNILINSEGIAWGDPSGPQNTYDWYHDVIQMGHVMQSYQNYSSGTSQAYFHHGIDTIAPNGTMVYTRSGGKVVNIENYRPPNDLYWEVAILDPEGYVWQFHHIDKDSIPQNIRDKYDEYLANPATGGYVPPNTHIGDIVYWTVESFGYRFNHIHLNILAAGDVFINPLEFHVPLEDNQPPEIQEIGLVINGSLTQENFITQSQVDNYSFYVRTRDLFLSDVYYLPPYLTEFSIDGGEWTTTWEFKNLPGGASINDYVNDFFIAPPTCGNYSCRDFYIDLGFIPGGQRIFPTTPGDHTIDVRVCDYNENCVIDSINWTIETEPDACVQIPAQSDTFLQQTNNTWNWGGSNLIQARRDIQPNQRALHPLLKWDLSGIPQDSQVYSAEITLRVTQTTTSIFNLYHLRQDWIEGSSTGQESNSSANWSTYNGVNAWGQAGAQSTTLDRGNSNLWNATSTSYNTTGLRTITLNSAGVDVVQSWVNESLENYGMTIQNTTTNGILQFASKEHATYPSPMLNVCFNYGEPTNHAPTALDQTVHTILNNAVAITLSGYDIDDDPLTYTVISDPSNGLLSGEAPDLLYTPNYDWSGTDSFDFIVSDGVLVSELASVDIIVSDPTSASIIAFYAALNPDGINLFWESAPGLNCLGYNLYRSTSEEGERLKLNPQVIPPASIEGEILMYNDEGVSMGQVYYYWLGVIFFDELYHEIGPIQVRTYYSLFVPMITN